MSLLPTAAEGVQVRVRTDVDASAFQVDRATSWPWRVIRQLTNDAELSVEDSGAQVAFVVGQGPGA
jgi:hypothetical protein